MMEVRDLTYARGGRMILDFLSARFETGAVTAIIGRSGSGKSTLLSILSGTRRTYDGEVLLHNRPMRALGPAERNRETVLHSGVLPANPDERVADFILLSRAPYRGRLRSFGALDREAAQECIESFDLAIHADSSLGELPGGAQRRALLAFAFARSADYLLLDNPTDGLDLHGAAILLRAIQRYTMRGDKSILFATGDISFASQVADRILVMEGGKFAEDLAPDELDADLIKKYFDVDVLISRNVYSGRPQVHFLS